MQANKNKYRGYKFCDECVYIFDSILLGKWIEEEKTWDNVDINQWWP